MSNLDVEEKQVNNGKRKWCDRCGAEMIFKRVFNMGWWCPVCNGGCDD